MRKELIQVLNQIDDADTIKRIILNMDSTGVHNVLSLLEFASEDTRKLWLQTYTEILKY